MDNIYIVTSKEIINSFQRSFKEFKIDLGKSFTAAAPANKQRDPTHPNNSLSIIDIKDNFVETFINETGNFCYKMGIMGSLQFYTFPEIDQQIWLYKDFEKLVVPCKKGTRIDYKFLGPLLIELENRTSNKNTNTINNTIQNYYQKKNSPGTESI